MLPLQGGVLFLQQTELVLAGRKNKMTGAQRQHLAEAPLKGSAQLIHSNAVSHFDPKSIFDELVPLFKEAKMRREIIIVTHNANLVVNTDANQVIVANAEAHDPG